MHKKTTSKGSNVFLLKAILTTLILGFAFQFSFAQKQAASAGKSAAFPNKQQKIAAAKPAPAPTKEQIKANPKLEQSNAGVTAAFSDAVKNEPALQVQPAAKDISKKKGAVKPVDNNAAPAPAAKTAAEIEKKKALHKAAFKSKSK
ncbi:hypothetical protein [Ferruginibacter sp.]|nr:hypothetical protein [Ferruginibacter sp.]